MAIGAEQELAFEQVSQLAVRAADLGAYPCLGSGRAERRAVGHGVVADCVSGVLDTLRGDPARWLSDALTNHEEGGAEISLIEGFENTFRAARNRPVIERER